MRIKVVSFFVFFQELSNKRIKALRPKMTKIVSRGSCLKTLLKIKEVHIMCYISLIYKLSIWFKYQISISCI